MEFDKDMELFNGTTDKYFRENGEMELKTVLVSGDHPKEIFIKEIGF